MKQYRKFFRNSLLSFICLIAYSYADDIPPETDCPNAPKNVKELKIEIYINGPSEGSRGFFPQLCDSYLQFGSILSVNLKVGAYVGYAPDGTVTCIQFENNDCTQVYQYSCAYNMLSDFKKFVCCHLNENKDLNQCLTNQGVNLDKFKTCYERKDPSYDPQEHVLKNSKYLYEKAPNVVEQPYPFLNGKNDECILNQSFFYWVNTICKCFADPKPKPCK